LAINQFLLETTEEKHSFIVYPFRVFFFSIRKEFKRGKRLNMANEKNVKNDKSTNDKSNKGETVSPLVAAFQTALAAVSANPTGANIEALQKAREAMEKGAQSERSGKVKEGVETLATALGIGAEILLREAAPLFGVQIRSIGEVSEGKKKGREMALRNRVILAALSLECSPKEKGGKGFALGGVSADRLSGDLLKLFPELPASKEGDRARPISPEEIKAMRARIKADMASLPESVVTLESFVSDVTKALAAPVTK
jgi:hypothetical protein